MKRWLQWQWALPRLALVIVGVLGVDYLLGLAARSIAIRSGEQIFGSAVEVRHARVPFDGGQIELSGLCVSDPHREDAAWLEADYCELDVAARPLLSKKMVVDRGRIIGLRFVGESKASTPLKTKFGDNADETAIAWLAKLDEPFAQDIATQFESMKRTDALCARWESESATLKGRASALQQDADELQQSMEAAQSNQLRHDEFLKDLPSRIASIRDEFQAISADFERVPQTLENERREIIGARRLDEQFLNERLKFEPIAQESLTAYFLRAQVAASVEELVGWLRRGRQFAEMKRQTPAQQRGQQIRFAGMQQSPDLLIRSLEFQGAGRVLGQSIDLHGLLTGFTTQPTLSGEPLRLQLKAAGTVPLQVRATIDCTQPVARDELFVDCREFPLPEVTLGRSEELRLRLSPSVGSLTVSMRINGDQLSGDVQLVQKQVRIHAITGGELSGVPLAVPLQAALADVNSLAAHATLHGTIEEPACTLWSNLGPAVAEAIERALDRSGNEHAAQVLAQARQQVDERLAALERQVAEQQAKFASETCNFSQRLDQIARQQTRRERLSVEQLGRRLPANSLFR